MGTSMELDESVKNGLVFVSDSLKGWNQAPLKYTALANIIAVCVEIDPVINMNIERHFKRITLNSTTLKNQGPYPPPSKEQVIIVYLMEASR